MPAWLRHEQSHFLRRTISVSFSNALNVLSAPETTQSPQHW
jgi:hypothetical protein